MMTDHREISNQFVHSLTVECMTNVKHDKKNNTVDDNTLFNINKNTSNIIITITKEL